MKNLNEKIKQLFAKEEGRLNAKVVATERQKNDIGYYFEVPIPYLSEKGISIIFDNDNCVSLEAPAKAEFAIKKLHPQTVVYRIIFSVEDAAKADEDAAYFNTLVEPILKQAIERYENSFGGSQVIRYGRHFCKVDDLKDLGEHIELRLNGQWASNKVLE